METAVLIVVSALAWGQTLASEWTALADADGRVDTFFRRADVAVEAVAWAPDGRQLVTVSRGDDTLRLWDALTGTERGLWPLPAEGRDVAWSRDGRYVLVATMAGRVLVMDLDAMERDAFIATLEQTAVVETIAFNPKGSRLMIGDRDSRLSLWDTSHADPVMWTRRADVTTRQAGQADVHAVAWLTENVVLTGERDGDVALWSTAGDVLKPIGTLDGSDGTITSVSVSLDRQFIAASGSDVWVWRTQDRALVATFPRNVGHGAVAFAPDSHQLLIGGTCPRENHAIPLRIVNVTDQTVPEVRIPVWRQTSLRFSPDGRHLATAHDDGTVRVWNWGHDSKR